MKSRILFFTSSIFFFLLGTFSSIQQVNAQVIQVEDFLGNKISLNLKNHDTDLMFVFVSSNKCTGCVNQIGKEINEIINSNSLIKISLLIRVGNSPFLRRDQINMFKLNKESLSKIKIYFDVENDSTLGIESQIEVKGNFGKYKMYQTPGILIVKKNSLNKVSIYHYEDLFFRNGILKHKFSFLFEN